MFLEKTVCYCSTMNRIDLPHLVHSLESLARGEVVNRISGRRAASPTNARLAPGPDARPAVTSRAARAERPATTLVPVRSCSPRLALLVGEADRGYCSTPRSPPKRRRVTSRRRRGRQGPADAQAARLGVAARPGHRPEDTQRGLRPAEAAGPRAALSRASQRRAKTPAQRRAALRAATRRCCRARPGPDPQARPRLRRLPPDAQQLPAAAVPADDRQLHRSR